MEYFCIAIDSLSSNDFILRTDLSSGSSLMRIFPSPKNPTSETAKLYTTGKFDVTSFYSFTLTSNSSFGPQNVLFQAKLSNVSESFITFNIVASSIPTPRGSFYGLDSALYCYKVRD